MMLSFLRSFGVALIAPLALILTTPTARAADSPPPVKLAWLDGTAPATSGGVSWGVPWPRGTVQKTDTFTLKSADGKAQPLQSWPLAYWPDGSIKWTGLATTFAPGGPASFEVAVGKSVTPSPSIKVTETDASITIDTGTLVCVLPRSGPALISSMSLAGNVIARNGKLNCILQDGPDNELDATPPKRIRLTSVISKVTVEQTGPIRAVIKIEGTHSGVMGDLGDFDHTLPARSFLPFVVRLYFFAGQSSVRMVHTIIYDGDQKKDFIRGLGISFDIPFREEVQNRHVAFSNSNGGLWAEPVEPMIGRQGRIVTGLNGGDAYTDQLEGRRVPNRAQANGGGRGNTNGLLEQWAVWNDFKLVQPNAEGFTVTKRTNADSAWLHSLEGDRASGLVYAGDATGGLAVSVKNFWQSYPASLEVRNAATASAQLNVWLWSPDAPAMDMRHYDTRAHGLEASYEDVQEGFSTATGVGRTSELTLFATPNVPSKAQTAAWAALGSTPPLLVASPQYLHSTGVFGLWSLKDTSTPYKKAVEDDLDSALAFYMKAVDQAKWYGFWYFGNVMHSYDEARHEWRYDVGGTAWDNSELGTDMWLWYSFLRSGRADIYRMAEAMTRNTGEVATYHLGKFAGLGTRHGVTPWGDGAKEARISQAAYRRFYYYLSTDERTGDLMHDEVNADFTTINVDPMREALPPTAADKAAGYPTRIRFGPDWLAFCGNWMTEWERTGDTKWRDKIIVGAKCLAAMHYGARSGTDLLFGYDPKTGQLFQRDNALGSYNLAVIMGGAEVGMELDGLLDDPSWRKVWRQYCRLYGAPANVMAADAQSDTEGANGQYATEPRLGAYAALVTGNPAFAQRGLAAIGNIPNFTGRPITGPNVLNPIQDVDASTNTTAQNSLTTIELLELMKNQLPTTGSPAPRPPRARAAPRGGAAANPPPAG